MENQGLIIAVDGHSSTGKSTFAKAVAAEYGLIYVDTGALYRGVTLIAIRAGAIDDSGAVNVDMLCSAIDNASLKFLPSGPGNSSELYISDECVEKEIRSLEVASKVSIIAALVPVREYVDSILKEYGKKRGVVMDGRDIGTVVFPDADLKIFMTAGQQIRALRRYNQIIESGGEAVFEDVLKNVAERDFLDENRETAPLKKAEDAVVLDNSHMTEEDQLKWIKEIISAKWGLSPR